MIDIMFWAYVFDEDSESDSEKMSRLASEIYARCLDRGCTDLEPIISMLSDLAALRGRKVLLLRRNTEAFDAVAVLPDVFCRWSNVRLKEFAILGDISAVGADGSIGPVDWAGKPRECPRVAG